MSSRVPDVGLKDAIVHSVEHGSYPESEDVSSAELSTNILPALLEDLQKARDEVKADIRQLSRDVAPDVDGWIAQAKKLQADIEHTKAAARDIVQEAEAGAKLKAEADDAANKAGLLEKEVSFNEALVETLSQIKATRLVLADCQEAMVQNDLATALAKLKEVDLGIPKLAAVENTKAYDLVQGRTQSLKASLAEQATAKIVGYVEVNVTDQRATIASNISSGADGIEATVDILSFLDARAPYVKRLRRELDSAIIQPRLVAEGASSSAIEIKENTLSVSNTGEPGVMRALDDVWVILSFLHTHLPTSLCSPLSEVLLPQLIDDLTTAWLDPCVPVEIDGMPFFQQVLDRVAQLAEQIEELQWPASTHMLREWVQSAPKTWLAKRRETALGAVRSLLFTKLKERRTVERVETQMVSKGDALMGGGQEASDDAWDAAWEPEEGPASPVATMTRVQPHTTHDDEDDDASAWDLEDEPLEAASSTKAGTGQEQTPKDSNDDEADVDADAWGWGDEQEGSEKDKGHDSPTADAGMGATMEAPATKEITLKETYTVTAVPDGILAVIAQSVVDAETLTDSSYTHTPIGPAASALYTLPTFALAMYRATAATAYGKLDSGNMLIYNDSTRLADQLRSFIAQQADKDGSSTLPISQRPSSRLKLEKDIKALDTFARRSYGTEMESQRTILNDMLDGAQGFTNCTVEPYASACESAVEIAAGRLRDVHRQWEPILSRSALLQSLGSLLNTVTTKMIIDVQDMSDIGDEESKRLRSFCDKLFEVKELFVQQHPEDGKHGDMTSIYCPNWLKFQYLAEILDGSLADIKYLWIDGELSLEFDAEEVVDLVQALFADSEYRRRAIADIRRATR